VCMYVCVCERERDEWRERVCKTKRVIRLLLQIMLLIIRLLIRIVIIISSYVMIIRMIRILTPLKHLRLSLQEITVTIHFSLRHTHEHTRMLSHTHAKRKWKVLLAQKQSTQTHKRTHIQTLLHIHTYMPTYARV